MSFSEQVKEEVLKNNILLKECCKKSMHLGEMVCDNGKVKLSEINNTIGNSACCRKAFVAGSFLTSGYIVNPYHAYQFEIVYKSKLIADYMQTLFKAFDISIKVSVRTLNNVKIYVCYTKNSEQVGRLLSLLGANNSYMDFENIRIEKSVRNSVNRTVNCEMANISKMITSSMKEIEAIDKLINSGEFNNLNNALKETCILRKNNPTMNLEGLCQLASQPISKSGMFHRLKRVIEKSKEIYN